jgi:hypothetical protein
MDEKRIRAIACMIVAGRDAMTIAEYRLAPKCIRKKIDEMVAELCRTALAKRCAEKEEAEQDEPDIEVPSCSPF